MKTTYYTFTTWNENAMAAGFGAAAGVQQAAMMRQPERKTTPRVRGRDNVIDLAAWRSANLDQPQDQLAWDVDEPSEEDLPLPGTAPIPRPRKSRRTALRAELVSTLAVAAAALALILRVLMF